MDFLPAYEFQKCVSRYRGDHKVQNFSCRDQFLSMAFAQLTYRESLRDIETCLQSIGSKPYHMGFRSKVARSTLADANESREGFRELRSGADVYLPTAVLFELWYGVAKSARPEANAKRIELFFSGPVLPLPFDETDAQSAGHVRAELESAGMPIGAYDVLIAGQAVRHKFTVVTADNRDFRRVRSLACENWMHS